MDFYDPTDLKRFSEIGKFSEELMKKFFDYYNAATGEDGALTKREKALIALAVAHVKQCPYCIEIHTQRAKKAGCSEAEIAEAVMGSAALRAGAAATHGTHRLE